jgi:hypothetical protein
MINRHFKFTNYPASVVAVVTVCGFASCATYSKKRIQFRRWTHHATIRDAKLDPWTQPLRVPGNDGEFVLTHKPDPRPQWNPALYDFTPADQFDVRGTYVTKRTTRDGIGAPVVAVGREVNKEAGAKLHSAAYLLRRPRYRTF